MSVQFLDLTRVFVTTTGTGATATLGATVAGFLSFSQAGAVDGTTYRYSIQDSFNGNSEIGTGVYSAGSGTITRNPTKSTNGNNRINLSGQAQLIICLAAEDTFITIGTTQMNLTQTYGTIGGPLTIGSVLINTGINVGGGSDPGIGNISANGLITGGTGFSSLGGFYTGISTGTGVMPSSGTLSAWAIGNNFSGNAEVDFWNKDTSVVGFNSFSWYQATSGSTNSLLGQLGLGGFRLLTGSMGINTGTSTPTTLLTIAGQNGSAFPAVLANTTILHGIGANGQSAIFQTNTYGGAGDVIFQRADGSLGSESILAANAVIGNIAWRGYAGTAGYPNVNAALLSVKTTNAWSATDQSAHFVFSAVPQGNISNVIAMSIYGGVVVGTGTVDPGAGNLSVQGTATVNGLILPIAANSVLYSGGSGTAVAGVLNGTTTNKFLTQSLGNAPAWNTIQASDLPGSFSGFANPTASLGLAAVNGSATTAMRSDAAPALNQAIAPTWTGRHVFTVPTYINTTGLSTTNGTGSPLFVWDNPTGTVAAGYSTLRVWMGDNPTATPLNNVAFFAAAANGNGRTTIWGANIVVASGTGVFGALDGAMVGLEIDILDGYGTAPTNPFLGTSKNALELYGNSGGAGDLSSAISIWSNAGTVAGHGWFYNGAAFSRVTNIGVRFVAFAGDGPSFQTAAISDESNSTQVLNIAGSHTGIINMASNPTYTNFITAPNNAIANFPIRNSANFGLNLILDSGGSATQVTKIVFNDQGTAKFSLRKDASNNFQVFGDQAGGYVWQVAPSTGISSFATQVRFVGGEGFQFAMQVGGTANEWHINETANGLFYIEDFTNTKFPFQIFPNPLGTLALRGTGVSIGATTPSLSTLDVFGGAAFGSYAGVNAAPGNTVIVSGSIGVATTAPLYPITANVGTTLFGSRQNGSFTEVFGATLSGSAYAPLMLNGYISVFNGNGTSAVGINTTSPGAVLQVNGYTGTTTFLASGVASRLYIDYQGSGNNYLDGTQINIRNFSTSLTYAQFNSNSIHYLTGGSSQAYTPQLVMQNQCSATAGGGQTSGAYIVFQKSVGVEGGGSAIAVPINANLGNILWEGADTNGVIQQVCSLYAQVSSVSAGTVGANVYVGSNSGSGVNFIVNSGFIQTSGPFAGFIFSDRTNSNPGWQWYAIGGGASSVASLYNGANVINITYSGSVSIGSVVPDSLLTVNANSAASVAPPAGTNLHVVGGTGLSQVMLDAFGGQAIYAARRAQGSLAAPTAVQSNQTLCSFAGYGYGSTGYSSSSRAFIGLLAAQNWSDTAQATQINFSTTALNGTALATAMSIYPSGGVGIGLGTTDPGYGQLLVSANANPPAFPVSSPIGQGLQIVADNGNQALLVVDAIGGQTATFMGRAANGSSTALTALSAGQQIFGLTVRGYDGSAYSAAPPAAGMHFFTKNAWTTGDHSTYIGFRTTAAASTNGLITSFIQPSGGHSIGSGALTYDPGVGGLITLGVISTIYNLGGNTTYLTQTIGSAGANLGYAVGWNYSNGFGETAFFNNINGGNTWDYIFYDWNNGSPKSLLYICNTGGILSPSTVSGVQANAYTGVTGSVSGLVSAATADVWAATAFSSSDATPRVLIYASGSGTNYAAPAFNATAFIGNSSIGASNPSFAASTLGLMLAVGKANYQTTLVYGQTGASWQIVFGGYTGALSFTVVGNTNGTAITGLVGGTVGITIGMPVTGARIPADTVVIAITGTASITLNRSATSNGTLNVTFLRGGTAVANHLAANPSWFGYSGTPGDTFVFDGGCQVADGNSFCIWNQADVTQINGTAGNTLNGVAISIGVATGQNLPYSGGNTHMFGYSTQNISGSAVGMASGIAFYAEPGTFDWGLFAAASGFTMTTTGTINTISDPSTKKTINKIDRVKEIFMDIHPATWEWDGNFRHLGHTWGFLSRSHGNVGGVYEAFSSRNIRFSGIGEIHETEPLVGLHPRHKGARHKHTGRKFLGLEHTALLAVNWKATQEAFEEIDEIRQLQVNLNTRVAQLEARVAELEAAQTRH